MKKKLLALMLALVMCVAMFAGCAQTDPKDTAEAPPSVSQTPDLSPSPSQPDEPETPEPPEAPTEKTVTDMAGRTVTLPYEVTSVGTFGSIGVLNAFVETMGKGALICNEGSASFVRSASWAKYQYKFAPQIEGLPEFENSDREIIMENVLAVMPDVCLTMSKSYTEQLEAQGLNVIQLNWQQQDDVKIAITLLGEVFNAQDVAEDYLNYFDEMVKKANDLTAGVTERKNVVYGSITGFSQPHVIAEWWIAQAGGVSVTSEAIEGQESLSYTLEDLLLWAPDVMLLSSAGERADIEADDRLSDIPAVKDGAIYALPRIAHTWGNRTTEQPLTIMWTLNKLYPELYSDDDLKEDIKYFYSHFFNYEFSDADLTEIVAG